MPEQLRAIADGAMAADGADRRVPRCARGDIRISLVVILSNAKDLTDSTDPTCRSRCAPSLMAPWPQTVPIAGCFAALSMTKVFGMARQSRSIRIPCRRPSLVCTGRVAEQRERSDGRPIPEATGRRVLRATGIPAAWQAGVA